jgi:predicted N-formylglutamate amidohydrolase
MPGPRHAVPAIELIFSCEHGGNRLPPRYRAAFAGWEKWLASHRGYDPGALDYARDFARAFRAPLFYSTISRLLIELNRSPGHRQLFSARTRGLPHTERTRLMERYYLPYRTAIEARVRSALGRGRRVLHISCHSFAPRLGAVRRNADIGLLFDPQRAAEARFCGAWRAALRAHAAPLRVRRNYPYRGSSDGLIPWLRRRFPEPGYIGVELEVNQRFPRGSPRQWKTLRAVLTASLRDALIAFGVLPEREE